MTGRCHQCGASPLSPAREREFTKRYRAFTAHSRGRTPPSTILAPTGAVDCSPWPCASIAQPDRRGSSSMEQAVDEKERGYARVEWVA